jgi:hypothetical protein
MLMKTPSNEHMLELPYSSLAELADTLTRLSSRLCMLSFLLRRVENTIEWPRRTTESAGG